MAALIDQIKSSYDRFAADWKTNDGARLGGGFVEDGSLINPFGERADGRAAISRMYAQYFGGMLRGTSTTFQLGNVRAMGDDHAFVDAEQTIVGADGSVVLKVHLAALLRRDRDTWRFVDGRPYTYASPPPA